MRGEGQQGAIIRKLGADGIDDGYAFFADAVDEPWNAEHRVATKNHGVEPAVGESRVDDIHLAQAGYGFQIDLVIEHQQIPTLHERDAHTAAKKAMLRIGRTERAGSQQHDHGIRLGRMRPQHFQNAGGNIGNRVDAGVVERLGNDPREGATVLDHVGHAGSVAEIMVLHGERSIRQAANRDTAQVQKCIPRQREAGCWALEKLAAQNKGNRQHAVVQDLLWAVDVLEKMLERPQTLAHSGFQWTPLGGGKNLGQEVAEPGAGSPWAVAVDVESDTHLAHGGFKLLVEAPQLSARGFLKALGEGFVNLARTAIWAGHFVVGAEMPRRFHAAAVRF